MQFTQEYNAAHDTKSADAPAAIATLWEVLLKNSQNYLDACKLLQPCFPMPAFSAAYEALSQLCHALYEHYDVQAGTDSAMQVVCRELGMNDSDRSFVRTMQERRNRTSYQYPDPPALPDGIRTLVRLVETYVPIARDILYLQSSATSLQPHCNLTAISLKPLVNSAAEYSRNCERRRRRRMR